MEVETMVFFELQVSGIAGLADQDSLMGLIEVPEPFQVVLQRVNLSLCSPPAALLFVKLGLEVVDSILQSRTVLAQDGTSRRC